MAIQLNKPAATITVTGGAKTQITTCTPPKTADTYRLSDLAIYAFVLHGICSKEQTLQVLVIIMSFKTMADSI